MAAAPSSSQQSRFDADARLFGFGHLAQGFPDNLLRPLLVGRDTQMHAEPDPGAGDVIL